MSKYALWRKKTVPTSHAIYNHFYTLSFIWMISSCCNKNILFTSHSSWTTCPSCAINENACMRRMRRPTKATTHGECFPQRWRSYEIIIGDRVCKYKYYLNTHTHTSACTRNSTQYTPTVYVYTYVCVCVIYIYIYIYRQI